MQSRYQGPKKKVSQRRTRKMKKVKEALKEVKKARRMEMMVKERRGEGRNSGAERVFLPRYSTRLVSLFSLSFPIPVF
jgi:transposase